MAVQNIHAIPKQIPQHPMSKNFKWHRTSLPMEIQKEWLVLEIKKEKQLQFEKVWWSCHALKVKDNPGDRGNTMTNSISLLANRFP